MAEFKVPLTVKDYLAIPSLKSRLAKHRAELEQVAEERVAYFKSPAYTANVEEKRAKREARETRKASNLLGTTTYFLYRRGEIFEKVRSNA